LDSGFYQNHFCQSRHAHASLRLACLLILFVTAVPLFGQGGPPLLTDDPGTPGPRNWEINVGLTTDRRSTDRAFETPILDLNYGVGERIQLKFEIPFVIHGADGEPTRSGLGNSLMGVKWRFYDDKKHELQFSMYPQFGFNNPTASVSRGIVERGQSFLMPFEVTKKVGPIDVDGEAGYNFAQSRPDNWIAGLALGHQATPRLEVLGEIYRNAEVGTPVHDNTFDFGGRIKLRNTVLLLFMAGRSFSGPASGQSQLIGYFGLQFLLGKQPQEEEPERPQLLPSLFVPHR
jgi:Putative MetA-pathway of phenol degradation